MRRSTLIAVVGRGMDCTMRAKSAKGSKRQCGVGFDTRYAKESSMREITNRIAAYYVRAAEHMAKYPDELEWRRERGKAIKARFSPPIAAPMPANVLKLKVRKHG